MSIAPTSNNPNHQINLETMTIIDEELEKLELHENVEGGLKSMQIEGTVSSNNLTSKTPNATSTSYPWTIKNFFLLFLSLALAIVIVDDYQHIHEIQATYRPLHTSHTSSFPHPDPSLNNNNKERASPSVDNLTNIPDFSILPKRIYTVIGLEDSGTQFVAGIINQALQNNKHYREGSRSCVGQDHRCREKQDVMVQHFSLPWGGFCKRNIDSPVVDVVVPSQCTRKQTIQSEIDQCNEITKDIWGFETNGEPVKYPGRYQLDIVSHKEWYDAHDVEQFFIIVVRDETISSFARNKHCLYNDMKDREEKVGTDIIVNAINNYILKDQDEKVTSDTYKFWTAEEFQKDHNGKRELGVSAVPFGNNVALVSYETMMKLGPIYIKMLYQVLGIDSEYTPDIKDGNAKYMEASNENVQITKKAAKRIKPMKRTKSAMIQH